MKNRAILLTLVICLISVFSISAEHLVILTTNDLHSVITPDVDGRGGVLRRKVLFDSVKVAEKNVMLIDAGDAVQGTVYFSEFGGEVEYALFNLLGYDINIVGNHEFDNGMEQLANHYKKLNTCKISTNYNFAGTIFIDYENSRDFSDCNTFVYGHNMKNGSMFAQLKKYVKN